MTDRKHIRSISSLLLLVTLLALTAVRTEAFGERDWTFGPGFRLYGGYGSPVAAALQPDGKILVITYQEGIYPWKLRRFNSNGTVDTTFGSNGVAQFPDPPAVLKGIAVQPNGRIIVTGGADGATWNAAVWRFNSNGTPDLSFGIEGVVILNACFTAFPHLVRNERGLTPTYDIVVLAGHCITVTPDIYRLKPDGSPRTTFGSNGMIQAPPPFYPGSELKFHQSGIYLFLFSEIGKFSASTGDPDLTFGNQGIFSESPAIFDGCGNPADDYGYDSLAFQSTGNLLVGGQRVTSFGQPNPVLVSYKHLTRHDPNGSFDTTFSSVSCESGTGLTTGSQNGGSVNVQADDKIILTNKTRKIVERRMPDGTIDASFTAVSTTPHVMIQPDGKILIVGVTNLSGTNYLTLSRYLP